MEKWGGGGGRGREGEEEWKRPCYSKLSTLYLFREKLWWVTSGEGGSIYSGRKEEEKEAPSSLFWLWRHAICGKMG